MTPAHPAFRAPAAAALALLELKGISRRRILGAVWTTVVALLPLAVWLFTPFVHGAEVTFELSSGGGLWSLPGLLPGEPVTLPAIHQVTIVSDGAWEVIADARLVDLAGTGLPRSRVLLGVSQQRSAGGANGAGTAGGSFSGAPSQGEVDWVTLPVGSTRLVRRGEATGPAGEIIVFDLEIHPSWDDPPGVPFAVELSTTVTAAETAVSAYVDPAVIRQGETRAIAFWFRPGSGGAFAPADRPDGSRSQSQAVTLEVWRNDAELVARITTEPEHEAGQDGAPGGAAGPGGWSRVVWDSLPEGGLAPGAYRFRVVDDAGRLLGTGVFRVDPAVPPEVQPTALPATALGKAEVAAPGAGGGPSAHAGAHGGGAGYTFLPEIRTTVSGESKPPGEPAAWSITLINPDHFSLLEAQLKVCLSPGWSFYGASVPFIGHREADPSGGSCRTYLLGSLPGRSSRKLDLSLVYWDDGGRGVWNAGALAGGSREGEGQLALWLTGTPSPGGARVVVHEARIPLRAAADPLLAPPVKVAGRVFVDINGNGSYEAGEPLIPGAKVFVDGREVATTNRRGEYQAELPGQPRLLWVQSDRGQSAPLRLSAAAVWAGGGVVDVAISPTVSKGDETPQAAGRSFTGYALAAAELSGGSGGKNLGVGLRAGLASRQAELKVELQGGTSFVDRSDPAEALGAGELSGTAEPPAPGGISGSMKPPAAIETAPAGQGLPADPGLGGAAARRDGFLHGASVSIGLRDVGVHLAVQHESGLAKNVRLGMLRPSKPVEQASRARLELVLDTVAAESSSLPVTPLTRALLTPGLDQGRWEVSAERGWAVGDVWSCTVEAAAIVRVGQESRVAAGAAQAAHRRIEPSGLKEATARQWTLEADGAVSPWNIRIPYRVQVIRGEERELSPSCGLSPFDGWRWQVAAAPPLRSPVQGIEWSGMAWPAGGSGAGSSGGSAAYNSSAWKRAQEVSFSLRPLALGKERLNLTAGVQWHDHADGPAGGGDKPVRFAARLQTRIATAHDIRLELGALELKRVRNPAHLSRGDGRMALNWRVVRGPVRPWVSYEFYKPHGVADWSREYGVSLSRTFKVPWTGLDLDASLRVSRAVDPDDLKDALRLDLRYSGVSARFEWKGTADPAAGESDEEGDEASEEIQMGADAEGGTDQTSPRFKKIDWKLSISGPVPGRTGEWSLAFEGRSAPDETALSGTAWIGGRWRAGPPDESSGEAVERKPAGRPVDRVEEPWVGRWLVGFGRSLAGRNGLVEEFVTGVLRVAVRRGDWRIEGRASRKVGVHDPSLKHSSYEVALAKAIGNGWSAAAGLGTHGSLAGGKMRYRVGVEKLLGGEGSTALGVGVVWEVRDGSFANPSAPRWEVSLTAPFVW